MHTIIESVSNIVSFGTGYNVENSYKKKNHVKLAFAIPSIEYNMVVAHIHL